MKIVYMGTPDFAVNPLHALAEAGYEVAGVVTSRISRREGERPCFPLL